MTGQTSAIAVGYNGIWRTSDDGATWTAASSLPSTTAVRDISMVSPTLGFADTANVQVWKTVDGGATWTLAASPPISGLHGISMVDATHGVLVDDNSNVETTSDGWATYAQSGVGGWGRIDAVAVDANTYVTVGRGTTISNTSADASGAAQVTDYGSAPNNWAGTGNTNMFGVCLQAVGGGTSAAAGWTVDPNNTCTDTDTDPWKAVPSAVTKLAYVSAGGTTGRADLVWGLRSAANQTSGTYTATIVFEALAPNV
jgi:hypothetical protein